MIPFFQTEEEIFDLMVDHSEWLKKHNILKRDKVSGLLVSTSRIENAPFKYETVVADIWGIYPVQRYESKEEAEKGHKEWLKKQAELKEVTCLGYGERGPVKIGLFRAN